MSDSIVPAAVSPPLSARFVPGRGRVRGALDRWLRAGVVRKLSALQDGRVVIRDGGETIVAGTEASPTGDPLQATVTVHDPAFWRAVALGGSPGAADAYVAGQWSCDDLTSLLRIFVRAQAETDRMERGAARITALAGRIGHALRANTRRGSRRNIGAHYDLGNDFFPLFLDETLTYSCGIFEGPRSTLREASIAKLDRLCRKLDLTPDDHVLEIGTGWGSFALHAAGRYGCRVTTTTISREQHDLAQSRVREAGLDDRVRMLQRDYRDLEGTYDKLVSIEMIEAVGHANLGGYFLACTERLRPDGVMALQAITMPDQRYDRYLRSVDFIQRSVFPGCCVPSLQAMIDASVRAGDLRLVHLEDITPHYATTLRCSRERFLDRLDDVRALGYGAEFTRLWEYYLCYCEAGFAERYTGDVQMILARPGARPAPMLPPLDGASA